MPSRSRISLVVGLAVLGVLCLAAAAIIKWVAVPDAAELPSNENTTRQYDGNAKILLNTQALTAGDVTKALLITRRSRPPAPSRRLPPAATSPRCRTPAR